eukprot:scaffold349248_cov20-Prasinocladus_malaysianus.AAC.1
MEGLHRHRTTASVNYRAMTPSRTEGAIPTRISLHPYAPTRRAGTAVPRAIPAVPSSIRRMVDDPRLAKFCGNVFTDRLGLDLRKLTSNLLSAAASVKNAVAASVREDISGRPR